MIELQHRRELPLYRWEHGAPTRISDSHPGLWFDKFFDAWRVVRQREGPSLWSTQDSKKNLKHQWLTDFVNSNAGLVGNESLLAESVRRTVQMVEALQGRWRVFRTTSRFVTGMGRQHPVENGFAWHPTLGVPYLAGSSVKGLVRAWATSAGEEGDLLNRLFGPDLRSLKEEKAERARGAVAFLDALPVKPPRLAIDVMTPHYANWTEDQPPGDWRSPTPIPFLTTREGATFLFGVVPCGAVTDDELNRVMAWLEQALSWAGAGAKTAVGYGRMVPDETEQEGIRQRWAQMMEERRAKARLAELSPLDRELEEIRKSDSQHGSDRPYLTWLDAVRKGRWADDPEARLEVLRRIRAEMEHAGEWRLPATPQQAEKNKKMQRSLEVKRLMEVAEAEIAHREGEQPE